MHKRLLLAVFVCLFTFSMGMIAQQKALDLELLASVQGGVFNENTLLVPDRINFESTESLFNFHVKPSPKTETIIFDFGLQSQIVWWPGFPQHYWSGFHLNFISSVIPDNMSVDIKTSIDNEQDIHYDEVAVRTHKTTYKQTISKDAFLKPYVFYPLLITYKSTGDYVPDEIANQILNALISKGFDVKVTVFGIAEGVKEYFLTSGWIQVTGAVAR
jgi:hypothetical protein